ncbi:MAG: DUF6036 family nucleotidyltransferase [bacterium]
MYYEEIFLKLNEKKVKYVVVGGVALVLHGVIRMTVDLDLMIKMEEDNVARFISAMEELGYKPKVPVPAEDFKNPAKRRQWRDEKGMEVLSFFHPEKPLRLVDVFVEEPIDYTEIDAAKKVVKAKGIDIPLVSIRHLKQLKSKSGREQDLADIEALEEIERIERESG